MDIAAIVPASPDGAPTGSHVSVAGAAQYLGLSQSFLNKLRSKGGGPEFFKIGARVTYAIADLDEWLDLHRRRSTADQGEGD